MTAGRRRISSFAFRLIFHAFTSLISPLHMFLLGFISAYIYCLLYLWCSRGLIWTVKAAAVWANLPTCKGLIHIDLQMNWDQSRLDKACSPNTPLHPASFFTSSSETEDEGKHKSCLVALWYEELLENLVFFNLMSANTGNKPGVR